MKNNKKWPIIRSVINLLAGASTLYTVFMDDFDLKYLSDKRLQRPEVVAEQTTNYDVKKEGDYAILAVGFGRHRIVSRDLDKPIQEAYDALKQRGYNDENIILLSSFIPQGRDPTKGITSNLSKENLEHALDYVVKGAGDKGSITFFYMGHGKKEDKESYFQLPDQEFSAREFYDYLKPSKARKVLVFHQCYPGNFIRYAQELEGEKVVLSSAEEGELSRGDPDYFNFWKRTGNGENIQKAFRSANEATVNKLANRTLAKLSLLSKRPAIYSDSTQLDLPTKAKPGLIEHYKNRSSSNTNPKSNGLESILNKSLILMISLSFFLLFNKTFTGFAVLTRPINYSISAFFGILLFLLILFYIYLKIRKRLK